jgi:CobQ-like glutamine amidotransferase family enzyme
VTPDSAVRIIALAPDLLGTYGDAGNVTVLAQRLRWRGFPTEVVEGIGRDVPDSGDIYVLGGGEDGPQALAAREMIESGALPRAVERGAVIFGVCAGYQLLGCSFLDTDDNVHAGLGLLDCTTVRGTGPRNVGEVVANIGTLLPGHVLSGFENHGGVTTVGGGATPLATIVAGNGKGDGSHTEGAWSGRVVGTYLHGPVLARNPDLADLLLEWVVGPSAPLADADATAEALRAERIQAAGGSRRRA